MLAYRQHGDFIMITKEHLTKILPYVAAYANGEQIQYKVYDFWFDVIDIQKQLVSGVYKEYRIKPKIVEPNVLKGIEPIIAYINKAMEEKQTLLEQLQGKHKATPLANYCKGYTEAANEIKQFIAENYGNKQQEANEVLSTK